MKATISTTTRGVKEVREVIRLFVLILYREESKGFLERKLELLKVPFSLRTFILYKKTKI